MGFTRFQPIYDSVQIHTAIAAGSKASFFTTPKNQQANQLTTGTDTPYKKTDIHTNSKSNQTEKGQTLFVKGFELSVDEADIQLVSDLFINSKGFFTFYKGSDEKVFQAPLHQIVKFQNPIATAIGDSQSAAKAQKLGLLLPANDPYMLDIGFTIKEQEVFWGEIIFQTAITFKKFTFDYNTLAANAAYTTAFNLYLKLITEETRN